MEWRRQHLPVLEKDWSFGNPASMGDGIRAGEKVGGSTDLLDEAWWFPAMCWPDGRLQFMLNERMMPAQFVVNGHGERFINEAAPYMDFAHAMIKGHESGVAHIPCWLITDVDGTVVGAAVEHDGRQQRIGARGGVILAAGGFDHDMEWRRQHLPVLEKDWSFGNPASMGDGIRAGEKVGGSTDLLDEAWWFPAMCWPDGRLQFMLNERMMPSQFVVNGEGKRFINEAAPYMDFAHAMIDGQNSGVAHIPCWLVTDIRSFHRYVVGGHLPIPKVPFAPVPTGWKVPKAWLDSGVVKEGNSFEELATRIGVPPAQLRATADRFNELARKGHDDDFNRGDSAYDNYYGDPTLPNPNLHPLQKPPYYAFQIILGDLGTSGGLRTDEHARVLRSDDSFVKGLYAVGNASAAVMGRSYAGAGATIGPAMTFGYVAAKHIADQLPESAITSGAQPDSTLDSHRKVTK
jgi:hypothetical protein